MSERKQIVYIPVSELDLDAENYRLPPGFTASSEGALAAYLEEHYDLVELGESMARSGFRPEEPLIVVRERGRLVVVEGNRRLATVKLLTSPETRAGVEGEVRQRRWADLAQQASEQGSIGEWDLTELPCIEYANRSEIEGSLGFRHVSGIAQWSAESKARYISDLVGSGHGFPEIARMIGSKADYIRRQYVAHRALAEAKVDGVDTGQAERFFGVYYRSLSNPGNRQFIELVDWTEPPGVDSPAFPSGTARFGEFLSFVFGDSEAGDRAVISDSRQLDDLGRVLSDPLATDLLRSERDLGSALEVLGGDRTSVASDLRTGLSRLRRANGSVFEFVGDDELIDVAAKCGATVEQILATLQQEAAEA